MSKYLKYHPMTGEQMYTALVKEAHDRRKADGHPPATDSQAVDGLLKQEPALYAIHAHKVRTGGRGLPTGLEDASPAPRVEKSWQRLPTPDLHVTIAKAAAEAGQTVEGYFSSHPEAYALYRSRANDWSPAPEGTTSPTEAESWAWLERRTLGDQAMDALQALSKELVRKGIATTAEDALSEAIRQRPDLYRKAVSAQEPPPSVQKGLAADEREVVIWKARS